MALASQSHRSNRSYSKPNRLGKPLVLVVGGVLASITVAYWLMQSSPEPEQSGLQISSGGATLAAVMPTIPTSLVQPVMREPDPIESTSALERVVAQAVPPETAPISTPVREVPPTIPADTGNKKTNGLDPAADAPVATPDGQSPDQQPDQQLGHQLGHQLDRGLALAATDPVKARVILSSALLSGTLSPIESKKAADTLVEIGRILTFTPVYNANDPMFFQYTIQAGDSLEKIVRRHKIGCDWRLVARINNIKKPEAIRVGQRLKLPKGPFSAVVSKRDYRVDLCIGAGSERVVMTSMPCGLGSANGTPTGMFRVKPGSKLLDPEWVHPVTGEHFAASDVKNPIGEHWLGLEGVDATNAQLTGYGIHGTIDVDSIGQDRSLGCVRLLSDDVGVVWESLGDGASVEIR